MKGPAPKTEPCPACGALLNEATGVTTDDRPKPGDVTICFYCAAALRFAPDMSLRVASLDECDERVVRIQAGVRAHIRTRPKGPGPIYLQ